MSQPTPESARKRIVEIIGNSVYHALGLKESLADEHAALEQQDMDELRAAVDNKSRCTAALQTLEQQRNDFCVAAGFAKGHEQMEQLTAWCDEDDAPCLVAEPLKIGQNAKFSTAAVHGPLRLSAVIGISGDLDISH